MPMDAARYPANWKAISTAVRARSGGRCECAGECGRGHQTRCEARHGDPSPKSGWPVILTTAHLWRGPCAAHYAAGVKCDDPEHLKAMCQACHLAYDLPHHVARAAATRERKARAGRISRDDLGRQP